MTIAPLGHYLRPKMGGGPFLCKIVKEDQLNTVIPMTGCINSGCKFCTDEHREGGGG